MGRSEARRKAEWSQTAQAQLLAAYLTRRSEHTQRAYAHDLDCYARYCGLPSRLEAVRAFIGAGRGGAKLSLMAWAQAMSGDGVTPNTIRRRIGALRGLATLAADCEVIPWTVQMRLPLVRTTGAARGRGASPRPVAPVAGCAAHLCRGSPCPGHRRRDILRGLRSVDG